MAIGSILSSGLQGIQAGISRTDKAGAQIASFATMTESPDLAASLVDLKMGEFQVKASATVIKVGDQMLGTLIDIKA